MKWFLLQANVICIVYSVDDADSISKVWFFTCYDTYRLLWRLFCSSLLQPAKYLKVLIIFNFMIVIFLVSQISSYWIPVIHKSLSGKACKPIVLVGNKSDIMETSSMEVNSKYISNLIIMQCVLWLYLNHLLTSWIQLYHNKFNF